MNEVQYFHLPEMKGTELRELFILLIPEYTERSCIACGYIKEKPTAIIATNDTTLSGVIKAKGGVTELTAAEIPIMKYHLTGNKSLLPELLIEYMELNKG